MKLCYFMGKNTDKTKGFLEKCHKESASPKSTICCWFADFKCDRTDPIVIDRSGLQIWILH